MEKKTFQRIDLKNIYKFKDDQVKLDGEALKNVDHFKHLGSKIDKDATIEEMWTFACKLHGRAGGNLYDKRFNKI